MNQRKLMETDAATWRFIFVNDLHYEGEDCRDWFEKIVAAMKASAPHADFCLLGGDLTDEGKPEQMAGVHAAFGNLKMPFYATPGNHDYLSETDRSAYERYFPQHINQVFEHRGWQIIGLDTCDGLRYADTKIGAPTLAWLDENLPKLNRTKPTVVWTHFPLGTGVNYRPLNADDLLNRLQNFKVQAIFSGHWHGSTETIWRKSTLTTNRCCSRVRDNHDGTKEKGWFVCTVSNGQVSREFVEIPFIKS